MKYYIESGKDGVTLKGDQAEKNFGYLTYLTL